VNEMKLHNQIITIIYENNILLLIKKAANKKATLTQNSITNKSNKMILKNYYQSVFIFLTFIIYFILMIFEFLVTIFIHYRNFISTIFSK
jgi:hypothetical protein